MIKAGINHLTPLIVKLFNLILISGKYPSSWAVGRIVPIHKKGDRSLPSNYRGITISSCLGKMFNAILNSRLYKFINENNLMRNEQIGFKKFHRTTDHLFILRNLISLYRKKRKALYLVFIDFQKAFDQVWHTGLFYKLATLGISLNFYSVVKDMYKKINLTVQCGYSISPLFSSSIGVRQGDNLSPTLFNIFVNDLPAHFDNCQPAKFGDLEISSLLYADDVVLMSESESGAQCALNKLKTWSDTWGLGINISKTKVMCTLDVKVNLNFNDTPLEQVTSLNI